MSKKYFIISLVLWIVLASFYLMYAGVQVRSFYTKQFKFDVPPGQRLVVVDENHTQVRVYPKESRIFDTGRLEKRLVGVLTEK